MKQRILTLRAFIFYLNQIKLTEKRQEQYKQLSHIPFTQNPKLLTFYHICFIIFYLFC